jgi:hypothetical protein
VHAVLRYLRIRPYATSVSGLTLLVYATSVCGLTLLV